MANLEGHKQIEVAIHNLHSKLGTLDIQNLQISDYNKEYLKKYIQNYSFYMSLYSQLLIKSLKKLNKPLAESIFVDYGGGCGMLSYLAKEVGFKSVIYNDIYEVSVNDTKTISKELAIKIDKYIHGDIDAFLHEIKATTIEPDLICSFDVLEHIYDLKNWFRSIATIKNTFSLVFMTSANAKNPYINYKLKKLQIQAEFQGMDKTIGWKASDLNSSFLEARKTIIRTKFSELKDDKIEKLSRKTRGLRKDDIEKVVKDYIKNNRIDYHIAHPTNTCDPHTGNWTENLIDLRQLKKIAQDNNFNIEITNSFYSYSKTKILNFPKQILNLILRILGPKNLFFSPTYTLEIQN